MRQVIVRYKLKPDRVEENEELVRAVYEELGRVEPAGIRYATFRLDDGVSFLHFASIDTEDGQSPLGQLGAFQRFQEHISDRCDEPPEVTDLHAIGSYRL
jgi:quinol monooxygenase YgiN